MEVKKNDEYELERFSKTKEEFDEFYDSKLKHKVDTLEKSRQETMELAKKQVIKFIPPIIVAVIIFFFFSKIFVLTIPVLVFIGGYLFKKIKRERKKLLQEIKGEIVTDLVYFMNEKFTYKPNKYLSPTYFKNANIFKNKPNRFSGDDLITGYVGGASHTPENAGEPRTDVSFSEIKADLVQKYRDKDGKMQEDIHTIFKGLFFKVDFNKDFDGLTIVVPKEKSSKRFSFFKKEKENRLEEVELESLDFMDKFTVKTTDQILARYILTPGFMERLLEFSNRDSKQDPEDNINQPKSIKEAMQLGFSAAQNSSEAYSDTPYFSFRNGTMYFMLPTEKDHFDFSLYVPLDKRLIYSYFYDINIALELVDELNLNLRIWGKE